MSRQKRNRALSLAVLALGFCGAAPGWAAVTPGGDTTVADTSDQDTIVGNTGIGTLGIDDGSSLENDYGYIGYEAGSTGTATVSGAGSTWITSGLYIGYDGSGSLAIEAGGQVSNDYSAVLGGHMGSTGAATVRGAGSTWTNSYSLRVGNYGSGTLTVADGGLVTAQTLYASPSDLFGNGTITVSGAVLDADLIFDSSHGTTQSLTFGSGGTLNLTVDGTGSVGAGYKRSGSLRIADGVLLASSNGYLGFYHGSSATATVIGPASKWVNSGSLYVGLYGSGSLSIEAGGQVSSANCTIGDQSYASGTVTVSGAGSVLTSNGYLTVDYGSLSIEAGGQVNNGNSYAYIDSGTVTVSGAGSKWTNTNVLNVGRYGSGTLMIQAGGQVSNLYGHIGGNAGSTGTAMVSGAGTQWTNSNSLWIGDRGNGALTIEAGGQVSNTSCYLGFYAGSTGTAMVRGEGSAWANSGDLRIGSAGSGTLTIESGGQVSNASGYLGYETGSTGAATVSGVGSRWTSSGDLYIGRSGSGRLTVSDGGLVSARTIYASSKDLAGNGTISVSGAVLDADLIFNGAHGTTQTLAFGSGGALNLAINGGGNLGVGYKGSGSLRIADGAAVVSGDGYLGYHAGSTGTATVSGAGSTWTNSDFLYVGRDGSGTLTIEGGGEVSNSTGYLGCNSGSTGTARVRGTGSKWTNSNLYVGYHGNGTLIIEAGGQVSGAGYVGYWSGSTGTVTVTGAGSTWTNTADLHVGSSGGSGSLTVSDGGLVTAKTLYASPSDLCGNGTITVWGAVLDADLVFDSTHGATQNLPFGSGGTLRLIINGDVWPDGGNLGVGYKGSGSLKISDGVAVTSRNGLLGYLAGSSGTATVAGAGSKWINRSDLTIGISGIGMLTIEDGGQVKNWGDGCIGSSATGKATVSGEGSKWTNDGELQVGRYASGTLSITAGGQVSSGIYGSDDAYLGYYAGSTGTATVSGAGSTWTNSRTLYVGYNGRGTLTVADGGKVSTKALALRTSESAVRMHVSGNDILVLGNAATAGALTNNGTIAFYADASLPAGVYRPISEYAGRTMTWSGSGSYKAFGGVWDNTAKTFAVAELNALSAGDIEMITSGERLLFTDLATGKQAGASFGTIIGSVSFSAAPMGSADLAALVSIIKKGQGVLSAWDFATNFSGGEALLSFDIGSGAEDLAVWRYSGGAWSEFVPSLFTYDANGLASFTVSSFSGYAVTAAVPEPGTLGLMAFAGAMLLVRRRK